MPPMVRKYFNQSELSKIKRKMIFLCLLPGYLALLADPVSISKISNGKQTVFRLILLFSEVDL